MRKSSTCGLSGYRGFAGRGSRTDAIIIDFSKAFDLVPYDRLFKENRGNGNGFEGSCLGEGI